MTAAEVCGRESELRRSLLVGLADFGDAALRGPALRVILFASIVALELVLASSVKATLLASSRCLVHPENVVLGPLPAFVPDDVAAGLRRATATAPCSIVDPALEPSLRRAVESHPWVRRVTHVRRLFPSRVALELELRAPFALVDVERWRLTVDEEGVVLEDRSSRAPEGLPVVRADARVAPGVPQIGRAFRSQSVLQGLKVVKDLRAHAAHAFLRDRPSPVVDVTRATSSQGAEISLELAQGVVVEWGGPPDGSLSALETPTTRKLDALLEVSSAYPGLRGVTRINVLSSTPFVESGG
jgi:hypothetical protein